MGTYYVIDMVKLDLAKECKNLAEAEKLQAVLSKKDVPTTIIGDVADVNRAIPPTKIQKVLYRNLMKDQTARAPKANLFQHIFKLLNEDYIMPKKKTAAEMKRAKKASKKTASKKTASKKTASKKPRTGVCALVHEIANTMYKKNKDVTRAEVLEACIMKDVNPSTAKTQYQKWKMENFV